MINKKCGVINKLNNKCKQNSYMYINNKYYCYNHAKLNFNKYVLIIQKHYRSYKNRRIIKYIYINLPDDIQRKIKYYINYSHYTNKYYKTINTIINNKIDRFALYINNSIQINDISYIFNIAIKYYKIININYLKFLYIFTINIEYFLLYILPEDYGLLNTELMYIPNINLFNIINYNNCTQDDIFNCIILIKKFKKLYNN